MKLNKKKIEDFFASEMFDDEVKNFVSHLIFDYSFNSSNLPACQVTLLSLYFYDVEKGDDIDEESPIFNIPALQRLTPQLRTLIIDILKRILDKENRHSSDEFASDFLLGMEILVYYKDWERINRKNKLENLNKDGGI